MQRIFPRMLRRGDTVGVVSPSSPITPRLNEGIEWLERQGFRVVLAPSVWERRGILAGPDKARLADFHSLFADPEIDAVLASGGGYGAHRLLLEGLDFELIRKHPKLFVGFSDITGLHLALWKQLRLVTVHGPNVSSLAGVSATARDAWLRAVTRSEPLGPVTPPHDHYQVIVPGEAEGLIVGGNIALVSTLLGTPYELDTTNRILFLENVDDRAYRLDRYLAMLRLAGKFDACAGVVFGESVELTSTGGDGHSTLHEILRDHLIRVGKPAVYGFPAGHLADNFAFPLGTCVRLYSDGEDASVIFTEGLER